MKLETRLFFALLSYRLRMFWRRVLRLFGVNNTKMAMDDLYDTHDITRISIGIVVADGLKQQNDKQNTQGLFPKE